MIQRHFKFFYKSQVISVSVEKTLFESNKSNHFFIHYQIKNLSEYNLGVYMDAYFGLFYPNQWGLATKAERDVIDEERIIPMSLTDSVIHFMESKYQNSRLAPIAPGDVIDYYRDFNASHKKEVRLKPGEFMYISMDGQLIMTNGSRIEHAHFNNISFTKETCIFLSYPLIWKKIPADSKIYYEN